jgi:hypothetical protein
MWRVLEVQEACQRKTLRGLDNTAADGAEGSKLYVRLSTNWENLEQADSECYIAGDYIVENAIKKINLSILITFIQRFILVFNFPRNPPNPRENPRVSIVLQKHGFLASRPINARVLIKGYFIMQNIIQ